MENLMSKLGVSAILLATAYLAYLAIRLMQTQNLIITFGGF
jgi:hypothetical protein